MPLLVVTNNISMKISGVLQLTNRTLYGMTARHAPMYLFTPLNRDFPPMTVASTEGDKSRNKLALVEPLTDEKDGKLRRGALCGFIGDCGDPVAERKAIHLAYFPVAWKSFPLIVEPAEHGIVLDVPTTINIDPPGCMDIDDCISIWEEDGITKVAITIADVGEWVLSNPWMMFAEHMGQTIYDENGAVLRSLFPHEYRMSLLPGQKRLGIALMFDWADNMPVNLRFREVTIFNKKKHTYDSIYTATDFPVKTLREICGVIGGEEALDDSHKWVETLMMFYNISLAKHLIATGRGGILRAHDAPAREKMVKYSRIGLPEHLVMSSARYVDISSCEEHYAINSVYCHGTSPIRRWVDVVNQLSLKDQRLDPDIALCNTQQSYGKKHRRDLALLGITEKYAGVSVGGVVISGTRVWVPDWNRMISVMNECEEGSSVRIDFHVDMNKPTWKQRVVFRCS